MWLTGRLAHDFKMIADFRHDNPGGIRNVLRHFVSICCQLKLPSHGLVAVDGSLMHDSQQPRPQLNAHKLAKRMQHVEESIARYRDALDTVDRTQPVDLQAKTSRPQVKLVKLRKQLQHLREIEVELAKQPDQQWSQTDPDVRSMATSGRGTGMVGNNVQVAADTKHHLIVAADVVNEGHDRGSFWSMAQRPREAVGEDKIELITDRGYFKGPEIVACEQAAIKTYLPKPMTSNSKAEGRVSKADFIRVARDDECQCPTGPRLPRHHTGIENGLRIDPYHTAVCPLKAQCTTGQERRVRRWEHEAVLDTMRARLDRKPDAMKVRGRTIEHDFGTLKHCMGSAHLLMKSLVDLPTEISLHALAFNFKRVISAHGIARTTKANP